jgi:Ribosomal L22e protein family
LQERIKVDGRTGNLGDNIIISQTSDGKIEIVSHNELSGRYLKYLYAFFVAPLATVPGSKLWLTVLIAQDEEVPQEDAAP